MNPGIVETQFDIPIIIPAYFGAISKGFTMNPVKEKPKNATAIDMKQTVIIAFSAYPEMTINTADPAIPE